MSQFDYVILGGGCAGLSLAYELEVNDKLQEATLAIVEPRASYERDKTWSFWRVEPHRFADCVIKEWSRFQVRTSEGNRSVNCGAMPYESIDSGLFYDKVLSRLACNPNVSFVKGTDEFDVGDATVFNSVPSGSGLAQGPWQHFKGLEIKGPEGTFTHDELMLMDFDCDQRGQVHFFYVLPFSSDRALVETTWLGPKNVGSVDYDEQLRTYIERQWGLDDYEVAFTEQGAIPLFEYANAPAANTINIGAAGGMVRQSTGYAFLNIQAHSRHICANFEQLQSAPLFQIGQRYRVLDRIFLRVMKGNPELMPEVFDRFFRTSPEAVIPFLSNRGTLAGDASAILGMPKMPFLKALVGG